MWVYSLFTDVPGDYVKKPMKECTGKEITAEWLYHLGIPVEDIGRLAGEECNCTPTMMPYITAFFMPRAAGDRPDVIPDGSVNAAFLGQFAETPRDTISPQSTLSVPPWRQYTDSAEWTAVCRRYGAVSTM